MATYHFLHFFTSGALAVAIAVLSNSPLPAQMPPLPGAGGLSRPLPDSLQASYDAGVRLLDEENFAAALQQFQLVAAADPRLFEARVQIARCYDALGEIEFAIDSYSRAITIAPPAPELHLVYFARGQLYLQQAEPRDALSDFNRAVQMNPVLPEYLRSRAEAQLAIAETPTLGDEIIRGELVGQAKSSLQRALKVEPESFEGLRDLGRSHFLLGELAAATENLAAAAALRPEEHDVALLLSQAYLLRGQREADTKTAHSLKGQAVAALTRGIDAAGAMPAVDASEEEASANLALLHLARAAAALQLAEASSDDLAAGLFGKVPEDAEAARRLSPTSAAEAWLVQARAELESGQSRQAIRSFSTVLQRAPSLAAASVGRGRAWLSLGESDLAIEDFRQAATNGSPAVGAYWQGVVHARRGDHDAAIDAYTTAIELDTLYTDAYRNRGLLLLKTGQWRRAINDYNRVLQADPGDADTFYRRGLAQKHLGDLAAARRSWQTGLVVDPTHPQLQRVAR